MQYEKDKYDIYIYISVYIHITYPQLKEMTEYIHTDTNNTIK